MKFLSVQPEFFAISYDKLNYSQKMFSWKIVVQMFFFRSCKIIVKTYERKRIVRIMGENVTTYSENPEFNCDFEFLPIVLIVIGVFWCRDRGVVVKKGNFSGKTAICLVKKKVSSKKGVIIQKNLGFSQRKVDEVKFALSWSYQPRKLWALEYSWDFFSMTHTSPVKTDCQKNNVRIRTKSSTTER